MCGPRPRLRYNFAKIQATTVAFDQSPSDRIASLFDKQGDIAALVPGYVERWQQREMALRVSSAIGLRQNLIVEAGTGTGKTYAYLAPVLLGSGKTIISTGTRTLQDQLFDKDLPTVRALVRSHARVALLKGRRNYLCPERLDKHLRIGQQHISATIYNQMVQVREWSGRTRTGDLTELIDDDADAAIVPLVTSTADNCLGRACPRVDLCPLYAARARANESEIVVVNHHLLFADLALKDDNISTVLPAADNIVVDEAHRVADIARQFFGQRVGSAQMNELCRDIRAELAILANDDRRLLANTRNLEDKTRNLQAVLTAQRSTGSIKDLLASATVKSPVLALDLALGELLGTLASASDRGRGLAHCYHRAMTLSDRFAFLTDCPDDPDHAHWLELGERGFSLHQAPVSIASEFGARVRSGTTSWIFTSATLSVGDSFTYMRSALGLDDVPAVKFESPFDYPTQVRGLVPGIADRPGTDEHTHALVDICLDLLRVVPGRTFLLFTSYRALGIAASRLAMEGDIPTVVQGSLPRRLLLEKFHRTERCVLLATHSFWEGIDVRGDSLRLLVIDKLPFASPEDPVMRAKIRAMELAGGNGFLDCMVPEAAIALRQGFGRLIRDDNDHGLFILGDTRMLTHRYGQLFFDCLPAIEWLENIDAAYEYLSQLS